MYVAQALRIEFELRGEYTAQLQQALRIACILVRAFVIDDPPTVSPLGSNCRPGAKDAINPHFMQGAADDARPADLARRIGMRGKDPLACRFSRRADGDIHGLCSHAIRLTFIQAYRPEARNHHRASRSQCFACFWPFMHSPQICKVLEKQMHRAPQCARDGTAFVALVELRVSWPRDLVHRLSRNNSRLRRYVVDWQPAYDGRTSEATHFDYIPGVGCGDRIDLRVFRYIYPLIEAPADLLPEGRPSGCEQAVTRIA